ncbi:MAG: D-alanyl-D-alanine carboxypeptidase family protein [Eubacteriales bacterium]
MKKPICVLFVIIFLVVFIGKSAYAAEDEQVISTVDEAPVEMQSEAYILIEASSGKVLFQKNAEVAMPCANVIKTYFILMFLQAIDEGDVTADDEVTISEHAAGIGGSTVFLEKGETCKVGDLLHAAIINSANDAIVALAEKLYGGEDAFIKVLNDKASELGLTGTHIVNLTGNDVDGQTTTAADMAKISSMLVKYSLFFKSSTTWLDTFTHEDDRITQIVNLNKMIRNYEGCDGIKTGFSSTAGQCLASTAKKGNTRYIYVGLNAPDSTSRYDDAKNAFNYAFANYSLKTIVTENQIIKKNVSVFGGSKDILSIYASKGYSLLLKKDEEANIETNIVIEEKPTAPISKGQVVGHIDITQDGQSIVTIDIVAGEDISVINYSQSLMKILADWLGINTTSS